MTREECLNGLERILNENKSKILVRIHIGYIIHAIKYLKEQEPIKRDNILELLREQKQIYPHIDHTDCIWYRTDEDVKCPVTCSQYRDGWNNAIEYIFGDGKGYQPYVRGSEVE